MKKTLLLTVLLAGMTAQAEIVSVFAEGFTDDASCRANAYHNEMVGSMCWGANAANVLAWWQDQLLTQGYNLPKDVPTGTNIYSVYTSTFSTYSDDGGRTQSAMNWWITGKSFKTENVAGNGGYYKGLLNQDPASYYMQENLIGSCGPGNTATLEGFSAEILDNLSNGRALIANLSASFSVTVWGVKYDTETKKITHLYYADPHDKGSDSKIYCGALGETTISGGDEPLPTFYITNGYRGTNGGTIMDMYSLTCNVEEFLTEAAYTDKGSGAFAPFGNVELDSGTSYTIAKAVKAAAEGSALEGKANGDLTIKDGTAILADGASIQGKVIFSHGSSEGARKLSVQADDLTLSCVKVDATTNNTLEVTDGNDVTIKAMEGEGTLVKTGDGTLVNGGTLGNIELQDGTLKGSGTFGMVTINGGEMIVGNSPGHQDYEGALTLNSGKLVFCVSGFEDASTGDNTGWDSDTYSTINMNGHDFVIGPDGKIVIAMSADAAKAFTTATGTLELTLVTELKSGAFSDDQLAALAQKTSFELSLEEGAGTKESPSLSAPNFSYKMLNNALVLTTGISGSSPTVPEPTTGTLGLLALAGLCIRRRRK